MSEHQYDEFVALDRPLTSKEMSALRAISSRAEITSTRFLNEYHYGDLKADATKLLERYFDAHLYFANWGTHRLMLRVPKERVDAKSSATRRDHHRRRVHGRVHLRQRDVRLADDIRPDRLHRTASELVEDFAHRGDVTGAGPWRVEQHDDPALVHVRCPDAPLGCRTVP